MLPYAPHPVSSLSPVNFISVVFFQTENRQGGKARLPKGLEYGAYLVEHAPWAIYWRVARGGVAHQRCLKSSLTSVFMLNIHITP